MNRPACRGTSHWPLSALSSISALLGVLLPLILVRIVSPAEVGTFKIFFLYLGIIPALSLSSGLRSGLSFWSGQGAKSPDAIAVSSSLVLVLAACSTALILTFQNEIADSFRVTPFEASLFAISLLGAIGGPYFEEAAIAVGRIWTGALFYCCSEIIRTLAIVGALLTYRTLAAVLIAHTGISTCKFIAGYLYGYRIGVVRFSLNPKLLGDVLRYALPVSLAYIFAIFIASSDQMLLASRITPSEFALYSMGCLSIAPLVSFEQSVTRVLIPRMSEAFTKGETKRAALLYQSGVDTLAFILIPAAIGLMIFATPVIELFFTARYAAAAGYLQIFALSYLLLIFPHDALARARGQSSWILRSFIMFSLVSFILSYSLIAVAGPMGALSGLLLSGTLLRAYSIHHFKGSLELTLLDFLPLGTLGVYTGISLALAEVASITHPYFHSDRAWFLGAGSLFLLSYLCVAIPVKNRAERRRHPGKGVLILTQTLRVGGIERMILNLSRILHSEHYWQMHVLAYDHLSDGPALVQSFHSSEISTQTFKKGSGFSPRVVYRILRAVYANDVQILHSHDLGTLIYAAMAKLCSFGRLSLVHTQHSFPQKEEHLRYRIYRRIFSLAIDELAVVSDDVQRSYASFITRAHKIHRIPNGVEFTSPCSLFRKDKLALRRTFLTNFTSSAHSQLDASISKFWIVYQARFSPGKGQDTALEVWKKLNSETRERSCLCLVGTESVNGECERIRSLIRECPDQSHITLVEGSTDPLTWLRMADLFISCSAYEGMPLAPLEAAGSGLPLVLSAIPGHDFLKQESYQFPLSDLEKGAACIEEALSWVETEGEGYQAKLWESRKSIRERFSIQSMANQYSALYDAAIR